MMEARAAGGGATGTARCVAPVVAHDLGTAASAIKAAQAATAAADCNAETAGRLECRWQREHFPEGIRALMLEAQRQRNDICWWVFNC